MADDRDRVLRLWNESAPYWEKHSRAIETMFGPISRAMIEQARISAGDVVLDVAAGVGDSTLDVARACGQSGWVVGTDLVWGMVSVARRRAGREDLHNAAFVQCGADALPFVPGSFDAVLCRLGVMFFIDPVHDLQQLLAVLKPGGRLCFAVWATSERNPFFTILPSILKRYVSISPTPPDAPGAFRFAEPGKLAGLLDVAGATQIHERVLTFDIEAEVRPEEFWTLRSELSDALRAKVKQLSAVQIAQVKADLEKEGRAYFKERRMSFPAEGLIVTAVKPGADSSP